MRQNTDRKTLKHFSTSVNLGENILDKSKNSTRRLLNNFRQFSCGIRKIVIFGEKFGIQLLFPSVQRFFWNFSESVLIKKNWKTCIILFSLWKKIVKFSSLFLGVSHKVCEKFQSCYSPTLFYNKVFGKTSQNSRENTYHGALILLSSLSVSLQPSIF